MRVAGRNVENPTAVITAYLERPSLERTVRRYDLYDPAEPNRLAKEDIRRTRQIGSRISERQADWLVRRSSDDEVERAWSAPALSAPDASLADADPMIEGALYDEASELFRLYLLDRPKGFGNSKLHKVLHPHRRNLFPIFDRNLERLYRAQAKAWGRLLSAERGLQGHGGWAAVRDDLIFPDNAQELADCRRQLAQLDEPVGLAAQLSDLRLLDIISWWLTWA